MAGGEEREETIKRLNPSSAKRRRAGLGQDGQNRPALANNLNIDADEWVNGWLEQNMKLWNMKHVGKCKIIKW